MDRKKEKEMWTQCGSFKMLKSVFMPNRKVFTLLIQFILVFKFLIACINMESRNKHNKKLQFNYTTRDNK